ncbi:hypothetical protein ACM26V_00145 [Salipaludibacillus sp. HK11]|uniref:hypothetical protein n=1 Tax=Salipaludibacillus sp. HK11 TaxID=3394320 RepID=UPI0039FCCD6B
MFNKVQSVGSISDFLGNQKGVKREIKRFNKKAAAYNLQASLTTLVTGATAISISNKLFTSHVYAGGLEAIPVVTGPGTEYIKGEAKEKIIEAFAPLVDMIQALSYPIALVMLTGGALFYMINQKDKGLGLIQNASIGYILVQLMPLLMDLLVGVGETVAMAAPAVLI